MSVEDPFEAVAILGQQLESAMAVDPLAKGRRGSLAELIILNMVMDCPLELVQIIGGDEGSTIRRIVLEDPLQSQTEDIYLDRVNHPDGSQETVIDMSAKGWPTYKINPETGRTTRIINGKEKRAGVIAKNALATRLQSLTVKLD